MKAIIFASQEEADPFLHEYRRGRFGGLSEGESMHDDRVLATIVGIGKIKTTLRTERLLREHRPELVLHAGTCTALVDQLAVGSLFAAEQVFEGDRIELAAPNYPRMPLATPFAKVRSGTLVTQDHTLQGVQDLSYWQRIADANDMNGYAVAYVAATHGVQCQILKVVTGRFGVEDPNLKRTLAQSYATLAKALVAHLGAG